MLKWLPALLIPLALLIAACGDDEEPATSVSPPTTAAPATTQAPTTTAPITTTEAPATTPPLPPTTTAAPAPAMEPAEVVFEDQESDGTTIVVASVMLPSPGFIAVHGNADGSPGPVVGHSGLLPAGASTGVEIALDTPLTESDLLFPMAHIDVDGDGQYGFFPPDETVDGPARTADGAVAVVGATVTVTGGESAAGIIEIRNFSFGSPITVAAGDSVTVRNEDGVPHTWTSDSGVFTSDVLGGGSEFTFTFDTPGEYSFFCEIHPSMTGSITVTG